MTGRSNAPTRQAGQLQIFEDPSGDRRQRFHTAALLVSLLLVLLASAAAFAGLPVGALAASAGANLLLAAQLLMSTFLAIMFVLSLITLLPRHAKSEAASDLTVSVLVPAYNEESVICKTVQSLLMADCELHQIIVIDDGSTDATCDAVRRAFSGHPRVRLLCKPNGGKASALNFGLAHAQGDIVVVIDADTVVMPDAIGRMVRRFDAPDIGAVSGNMRVGNRQRNGLIGVQKMEYMCANNLERRGYSLLNCITVVPGAIGAYRRELLDRLGGYHCDTLAEDCDLTIRILRQGCRVLYEPGAVVFTEAPETLNGYCKQRFRWIFGKMQAMWKHRDMMLRPRYGALGMLAFPTLAFCQFVLPVFTFAIDAIIVGLGLQWLLSFLLADSVYTWHASAQLQTVVTLYLVTLLSSVYALLVEFRATERLSPRLLPQYLVTRAVLAWVCLQAFYAAFGGRRRGWNKLQRTASVELLPPAGQTLAGAEWAGAPGE